jgi:hypothetical protein
VSKAGGAGKAASDEKTLQTELRAKVFGGWPDEPCRAEPMLSSQSNEAGLRVRAYRFESQSEVELSLVLLVDTKVRKPGQVILTIFDPLSWTNFSCDSLLRGKPSPDQRAEFRRQMQAEKMALAFFAPRLVEPTPWTSDAKKMVQIRRRFMLLGQTLDGMRVWDIRSAIQALHGLQELKDTPICLRAQRDMSVNAAYATLFEPGVARLQLTQLPLSQATGPDYLNVLNFVDLPQILSLLGNRVQVR